MDRRRHLARPSTVALCAYLTTGYAFGHLYMLLLQLHPDSFAGDARLFHHTIAVQPDLIHCSYITLVAFGANGIAPFAPPARCLSRIEGLLGVMYLTVYSDGWSGFTFPRASRKLLQRHVIYLKLLKEIRPGVLNCGDQSLIPVTSGSLIQKIAPAGKEVFTLMVPP